MSCKYKEECPSYSGWCELPKQDFSRCVSFLITAYDNVKEELNLCKMQLQGYKDTDLTPDQLRVLITAYENAKEELSLCKMQLQEYKDTGLTPEQMLEIDREYAMLAKEVAGLKKNNISLKERLEAFYNRPIDEINVESVSEVDIGNPVGNGGW